MIDYIENLLMYIPAILKFAYEIAILFALLLLMSAAINGNTDLYEWHEAYRIVPAIVSVFITFYKKI